MLSVERYKKILESWKNISKTDLIKRVKRGIRHNIRNTPYFDLAKRGSYVKVVSLVTETDESYIMSFFSSYDKQGIYKYKFPLWYLSKIADCFEVSLEFMVGITDDLKNTDTAMEYMEVCEVYKNDSKLVVAENVRLLKGLNGICTNEDIGKLLGISPNTVKANISTSTSPRISKNMFTIEQIYKLAEGFGVDIERMFLKVNQK